MHRPSSARSAIQTTFALDVAVPPAALVRPRRCGDLGALGDQLVRAWVKGAEPAVGLLDRLTFQHMAGLEAVSVREAVALVGSVLKADESLKPPSYRKYMVDIARFVERLRLVGVEHLAEVTTDHVRAFVEEPSRDRHGGWVTPAAKTMQFRRTVVRRFLGEACNLCLIDDDPSRGVVVPTGVRTATCPLTDAEEEAGRIASRQTLFGTRLPAAWALGRAFATKSEMGAVRADHVDLVAGRVWLQGNTKRVARWVPLMEWDLDQIAARIAVLNGADVPLVYGGAREDASGCNAINEVFALAGLTRPGVLPASLAAWAGRRLFDETHDIAAVARALGVRLDRAAEIIGWSWR